MSRAKDNRNVLSIRVGMAIMLVAVLVLALRSQSTVKAVLAGPVLAAETASAPADDGLDMASIAHRDSLIAAARPVARDPFNARSVAPSTTAERRSVEAAHVRPILSALLFDRVNPSTQINVNGQRSGWLHQGETFQGWTVTAITSDAVTITKGGDTVVLP